MSRTFIRPLNISPGHLSHHHIYKIIYVYNILIIQIIWPLFLFKTNCRYHWWHLPNVGGIDQIDHPKAMNRRRSLGPHMFQWDWNMYLHENHMPNVGKSSSPMEHLGSVQDRIMPDRWLLDVSSLMSLMSDFLTRICMVKSVGRGHSIKGMEHHFDAENPKIKNLYHSTKCWLISVFSLLLLGWWNPEFTRGFRQVGPNLPPMGPTFKNSRSPLSFAETFCCQHPKWTIGPSQAMDHLRAGALFGMGPRTKRGPELKDGGGSVQLWLHKKA